MRFLQKPIILLQLYISKLRRRIRNHYYRLTLQKMGKGCQICDNVFITDPEYTYLGDRVNLNEGVILQAFPDAPITIGNDVNIAYGSTIITGSLDFSHGVSHDIHVSSPVVIEDGVVINAQATILPGVTLGKESVVAAGSLVTQNVQAHTLVFGVPARVIKKFEKYKEQETKQKNP